MAKSDRAPSEALALGMLAELLARRPAASPPGAAADAADAAILAAAETHAQLRRAVRAAQLQAAAGSRSVAQTNQARGEVLLARGKLQARMDALRLAQAQASSDELGRKLRRQRAELAVEAEALDRQLAQLDATLAAAKAAVAAAQADYAQNSQAARQAASTLQALQAAAAPLPRSFAAVASQLQQAHCRLFLAQGQPAAVPAWRAAIAQASAQLQALHGGMAQGRYAKDAMDAYAGGRATATGEAVCALVAAGEAAAARRLFAAACAPELFFHQIFPVFRAYSFGLYLQGDVTAVAEAARLHRYAEGLRGALAEAWWQLLHDDGRAFAAALAQVVAHDWRTWSHTQMPAMGLVSTTACALARLGRARGLTNVGPLGPTAPPAVWADGAA